MAARTRRRKSSGRFDPIAQRRHRFEAVLRPLFLWDSFARLPRRVQEIFCLIKFPDPVLEFDASFPTDRAHKALRRKLESSLRKACVEVECGVEVTLRDYFSVIGGMRAAVAGSRENEELPRECLEFMQEIHPYLEEWYEPNIQEAWLSIHEAVVLPLVAESRLDGRLMSVALKFDPTENGKGVLRIIVSATEPEVRRIELDGSTRPMYRVATSNEWDRVRWLSWDDETLGRPGKKEYPVYVQSHALRQLHRRVNLPRLSPYLEHWLYASLKDPNIVHRQADGDLLVEYRIHDDRLGYLVVTPLKDAVAVRTFLFLTMESTPEARNLKAQLRLSRRDVDWLGLTELAAFTHTDLRTDPVLRPLMDRCGCGHLFSLQGAAPQPRPLAAEMKRYLRLAA